MSESKASNPFRLATADDVPHVLELLQAFYEKAGGIYGIPFDRVSTIKTIAHVMGHGICLIGPSSTAGAVVSQFPYNHDARVAHVWFWYFKAAREIRIFEALMEACKEAGATHLSAASLFPDNRIGRFYAKILLHPAEIQGIRRL